MKQLNLILTGILLIAVVALFVMQIKSKDCCKNVKSSSVSDTIKGNNEYNIAFVNTDSLLLKYSLYHELKDKLIARQKEAEAEFNRKSSAFETEAANFQKKVQNNSFLSQASAEAQQEELYQKQQELLQLKDDLTTKLMNEEQELTKQLNDSVINIINHFNFDKKFDYIINNNLGSTLLYGNEQYDITDTIASILNSRIVKKETK